MDKEHIKCKQLTNALIVVNLEAIATLHQFAKFALLIAYNALAVVQRRIAYFVQMHTIWTLLLLWEEERQLIKENA